MGSQKHQFSRILHQRMPFRPWEAEVTRRLPGVLPLKDAPWLWRDEVFAQQMAYRDHLIETIPERVLHEAPAEIFEELKSVILSELARDEGYKLTSAGVLRPDGTFVPNPRDMAGLARLIQEDILVHERGQEEHILTSGALCFPANWDFAEKLNRPLSAIHAPIEHYDGRIAKGVQRMMDMLRPETPIWRANFLSYDCPDLHQPYEKGGVGNFLRVERQILRKLPKTGAVIFTLHTFVHEMGEDMRQCVTPHLSH